MDGVDAILEQWRRERPDLDVVAMGTLGRFARVGRIFAAEMERTLARFGLNYATFDVLATLRRSGAPYSLTPGRLVEAMMVTSGTVTNRIDQLEKVGLVARVENPEDRRSVLIALTSEGLARIDAAVGAHVGTQSRLLDALSAQEREVLDGLLRTLLARLDPR